MYSYYCISDHGLREAVFGGNTRDRTLILKKGKEMKFLHLSDLHIGKTVNGFSMIEEQRSAFDQVMLCISSEKPDAVVIAGDIYDRAIPSVEAVRLFDEFLTDLAETNVAVMIISGNHDSPERLNFARRLLEENRLFIYSVFNGKLGRLSLSDDYGTVNFWLFPFIKPVSVRNLYAEHEIDSYDEAVRVAIETANIDFSSRNVLISHQFYTKAGMAALRSESELVPVGGLDSVPVEYIEGFDYVALGHLHCSQTVGAERIRYCGSPVKYSFSEWRHDKSITVVEINEKGSLSVEFFPLYPIHDMREIKGKIDVLMSGEVSGLEDTEDYLRVILTDEEEIIDPIGKLRSVYPNIMYLDFENSRTSIDISGISTDIESVEVLSDYELFCEFFLEVQGSTMSDEQEAIVRDLLETEVDV